MNKVKYVIRRIPLEGVKNTRDLGGFKTIDGKQVKYKKLIRSGELAGLKKSDIEILKKEYKLRKIIDLRTDMESDRKPDPEIAGVEYESLPFVDIATIGITREKTTAIAAVKLIKTMSQSATEYMESMYRALVSNEKAIQKVKRFFEILLENDEGSVIFHCSAGKDRVGAATAILLSLLGVEKSTIIRDYMATEKFAVKYNKKYQTLASLLSKNEKVSEYSKIFLSTNKSFLFAMFDEIEKKYYTVENYAQKCLGMDEEKLERLKAIYLE